MSSKLATRFICSLTGMLTLTVTGLGAATTPDRSSTAVYAPRVGFSRLIGTQTIQGIYKPAAGRCAIVLLLIEGTRPARVDLSLAPGELIDVWSGTTGHLAVTCGPGGRSLVVASST